MFHKTNPNSHPPAHIKLIFVVYLRYTPYRKMLSNYRPVQKSEEKSPSPTQLPCISPSSSLEFRVSPSASIKKPLPLSPKEMEPSYITAPVPMARRPHHLKPMFQDTPPPSHSGSFAEESLTYHLDVKLQRMEQTLLSIVARLERIEDKLNIQSPYTPRISSSSSSDNFELLKCGIN